MCLFFWLVDSRFVSIWNSHFFKRTVPINGRTRGTFFPRKNNKRTLTFIRVTRVRRKNFEGPLLFIDTYTTYYLANPLPLLINVALTVCEWPLCSNNVLCLYTRGQKSTHPISKVLQWLAWWTGVWAEHW